MNVPKRNNSDFTPTMKGTNFLNTLAMCGGKWVDTTSEYVEKKCPNISQVIPLLFRTKGN